MIDPENSVRKSARVNVLQHFGIEDSVLNHAAITYHVIRIILKKYLAVPFFNAKLPRDDSRTSSGQRGRSSGFGI